MSSPRQKKMDQTQIISTLDENHCLDTIQLDALERSYRDWVTASARSDVRLSRMRILLLFLLIRYTGARLNEILSINPLKDIDLSRHLVSLKNKQAKSGLVSRSVPIPKALSREIQGLLSDTGFSESIKLKFGIDPGFVRRKFYERSEACGFGRKLGGPEMIRKARGVELLQSNMPLPAVQSLLGHSTPSLTKSMVPFSEKEIQRLTQLFMEQEFDRKTSARNSFYGKIKAMHPGDILSMVEIVTMDGFTVTATITNNSLRQLGLKTGGLVTAEIKTTWVILQKRDKAPLSCTAENQFKGTVTRVTRGEFNTEYVVRISDVTELCTIVTTQSARQLDLKQGDPVWALFNSFAVILHAG